MPDSTSSRRRRHPRCLGHQSKRKFPNLASSPVPCLVSSCPCPSVPVRSPLPLASAPLSLLPYSLSLMLVEHVGLKTRFPPFYHRMICRHLALKLGEQLRRILPGLSSLDGHENAVRGSPSGSDWRSLSSFCHPPATCLVCAKYGF